MSLSTVVWDQPPGQFARTDWVSDPDFGFLEYCRLPNRATSGLLNFPKECVMADTKKSLTAIERAILVEEVRLLWVSLSGRGLDVPEFEPDSLNEFSSAKLEKMKKDFEHISRTLSAGERG